MSSIFFPVTKLSQLSPNRNGISVCGISWQASSIRYQFCYCDRFLFCFLFFAIFFHSLISSEYENVLVLALNKNDTFVTRAWTCGDVLK